MTTYDSPRVSLSKFDLWPQDKSNAVFTEIALEQNFQSKPCRRCRREKVVLEVAIPAMPGVQSCKASSVVSHEMIMWKEEAAKVSKHIWQDGPHKMLKNLQRGANKIWRHWWGLMASPLS